MKRTTIALDDDVLLEAKYQAQDENRSLSAVIQDALEEYIKAHRPKRKMSSAGIVNVPISWTPEEMDRELMEGLDPIEGWSHDRRSR